ncbi:helix-turn-helix transcriptional regulator [uncultured Amnibacterium sp.]|uniref:helix-turn-helix transcriptional regulator n=1 Tax=uncultured Amnibacterium sp. TaxID=1631851 RepID=UPI0035CBA3AC
MDFELSFRGRASLDGLERDEADQVYSVVHIDPEPGHGRIWDPREHELNVLRPVLYPDWVGSEFDGCRSRVVSISRSSVRDYARHLAGNEAFEVRFTGLEPRSARLAEQWYLTRRYLMDTIALTASDPEAGLIGQQLTGLIAASVLATFPNTLTEYLDRHDARPATMTAAVRRAVSYIDEHLQEPVTLADVSVASRLSVRALQDGFRRHLATTPMGYLRKARLDAARLELSASDPARQTVAAIARRWGFAHLGRFAKDYQDVFGEKPSETLRR